MPSCNYCGAGVWFVYKKHAGKLYCNESCLAGDKWHNAANDLPQHIVDEAVDSIHQGTCESCNGPGPIDVHTSYTVWSLIFITSSKSNPKICCRTCGRKHQLLGVLESAVCGWWGIPWGLIRTPIQVVRNIFAMFGGPEPEYPSSLLHRAIRSELLERVANGQPLGDSRGQQMAKHQSLEQPKSNRIHVECDECRKRFTTKLEMAGRSGKCPGCWARIKVPTPDDWLDEEDVYEVDEQSPYPDSDNLYDTSPNFNEWGEPASTHTQSELHRVRQKLKPKWTGFDVLYLVYTAAGAFVVLALFAGAINFHLNGEDAIDPEIAHNNPIVVPERNRPPSLPQTFDGHFRPEQIPPAVAPTHPNFAQPVLPDRKRNTFSPPGQAVQPEQQFGIQPPPGKVETAPVAPIENIDKAASIWVVLSKLRPAPNQGFGSFKKSFLVDYQLASGTPVVSAPYVLHLSKSVRGGSFSHTNDVPIKLGPSGTIEFQTPPQFVGATDFVATIALPNGRQKWKYLSGKLSLGGDDTAAEAPPPVAKRAGPDAKGKLIAIANPAIKSGFGPSTLTVDFVLQRPATAGTFLCLVATSPDGKESLLNIAHHMRQAIVGDDSSLSVRLFGAGGEIRPPFKIHLEERSSLHPFRLPAETTKIVSNEVSVTD